MHACSHALAETLRSFQRKLEKQKKEKADLQAEIEKLKKIGEEQIKVKK